MAASALAVAMATGYLWVISGFSARIGHEGAPLDGFFLGLVVGAPLGYLGAGDTRQARRFHWVCFAFGLLLSVIGVLVALRHFERAERLSGTQSYEAIALGALGEEIAGWSVLVFALFGLFVAGIGAFGRLSKQ
jgi:hypothetical protein